MRLLVVLAALAVAVLAPLSAGAQIATTPPADGAYEAWSPLTMSPVGPLPGAPPLTRWLDVRSGAGTTVVTFEPERRVRWRIAWGPHGPTEKRVDVDGEHFSTSRFEYDAAGHLARKIADGPGLPGAPWTFEYTTDAQGRVLVRRHRLAPSTPRARGRGVSTPVLEEQRIARRGASPVVTTFVDGDEVRRDRYDARGLLVETRWTAETAPGTRVRFALGYRRDPTGALIAVERTVGGRRSAADPRAPDPSVGPEVVLAALALPIERHEVELVLGAPHTSSDSGRGAARRIVADYADGCWLDQPSALEYDATGLLIGSHVRCICGFCVDAELPIESDPEAIEVTDLHWTRGPWIRLDGAIDVTAEHRVITPRGPIAAGELRAGDEVLASDGSVRVLGTVEGLEESELRLGRNLRTRAGTFAAGGLLFESELPRACAP